MNSVNFASSVLRIPSLIFAQFSENITSEYDSTFKSQEHDNDILFDTDWFGCERSSAQPAMVQVSDNDAEAELVQEPAELAQRELESQQQRELSQFFATVLKLAGPFHSNFERTRVVNFNTELTTGLIQILQETLQMIARELEIINSNHASWPQSLTSQKIPLIISTQSKELNKFIDRYHPAIVLWCAPNQRIKRAGVSDIVLKDGFMPHMQLTYDWNTLVGGGAFMQDFSFAQREELLSLPFNDRELTLLSASEYLYETKELPPKLSNLLLVEDAYEQEDRAFKIDLYEICDAFHKAWRAGGFGLLQISQDVYQGKLEILSQKLSPHVQANFDIQALDCGDYQLQFTIPQLCATAQTGMLAYHCNAENQKPANGIHTYDLHNAENLQASSQYRITPHLIENREQLYKKVCAICAGYSQFLTNLTAINGSQMQ